MWELIKWERLSWGFGWGGNLEKAGRPKINCSRFGEQAPLDQEGVRHILLFQQKVSLSAPTGWLLACSLGIRWRQWCYLSIPELPHTVAVWRHSGWRKNKCSGGKPLGFFPCNTWAQVPVQSDFEQRGSTLLFLEAHLTLQQFPGSLVTGTAPSEGTWTEGCWWVAQEPLLCCEDELVWHQFVGTAASSPWKVPSFSQDPFQSILFGGGSWCSSFHLLLLVVCLGFYFSSLLPLAQDSIGRIVEHCYFRVWKSLRPLIWEYKLHLSPGYLWQFLSNHKSLFFSAVHI